MKKNPRIAVDVVDGYTLSTVAAHGPLVYWPETCLFAPGTPYGRASRVLQTYSDATEALAGHAKWLAEVRAGKAHSLLNPE